MHPTAPRHVVLAYHFFHPDDVVSARIYADLARSLVRAGHRVTVLTSNRSREDLSAAYPAEESWEGVRVLRTSRPAWSQERPLLRLANTVLLLASWRRRARRLGPVDAIVVGTDPAFAALLLPSLRRSHREARLAHWCFDLYPDAVIADAPALAPLAAPLHTAMARACGAAHALVDIGPRMRTRLAAIAKAAVRATIPPWSLSEPAATGPLPDAERQRLFPGSRLVLLYSGSLGRGHAHRAFLDLARRSRARHGDAVLVAFAVRGSRANELRADVTPADTNVRLLDFADEGQLAARLAGADAHLVGLRESWSGVVVPSKFFAALAAGRPVLYAGPADSDIALWLRTHEVGWRLGGGPEDDAALDRLVSLPGELRALQSRAHDVYGRWFSRAAGVQRWTRLLATLWSPGEVAGSNLE